MILTIDFETRSAVTEIKKTGPWPYAEHPSTDVWCLAVKVDNQEPLVWMPRPQDHGSTAFNGVSDSWLKSLVEQASEIHAHNVQFELAIWFHIMHRRYGFPELPLHKLRDTAAVAAMHALPRKLEQACQVMGLAQQKDTEGSKLMLKMCKPRAPRKAEWEKMDEEWGGNLNYRGMKDAYFSADRDKLASMCLYATRNWAPEIAEMLLWHEDPQDIERLCQYCLQDVEAEYALGQALGELPPQELEVFQHDIVINTRGIRVDVPMVKAALGIIKEHERRLLAELDTLTSGTVRTPKQVEAGRKWLASRGVHMDDMIAATVKDVLKGELPADARRFLEIRQSLGKSSTAKYEAALHMVCADGRLRGFTMYHGAATGRFTGKGIQLQNLPRGVFDLGKEEGEKAFWRAVELVRAGDLDGLIAEFGDPMPVLSSVIRPLLLAAEGYEYHAADFSAIEGRGLAWLAGEEWVLDAYRAYDWGEGPDMYMVTAGKILEKPADQVSKTERKNPGKPADLGCFGPDTRVLTSNGIKRIAEVSTSDRLWDGVEWVPHDGLIEKGEKVVIDLCGVEVTPDHLIHAGRWGWKQARTVASCGSMRLRALEKGSENLPSLAWREYAARARGILSAWFGFNAPVGLNPTLSTRPTCGGVNPLGVMPVLKSKAATGGSTTTPMLTSAPMKGTAGACSTGCRPASGDATTSALKPTPTTEGAGYTSTRSGGKVAGNSCGICSLLKAGISRTSSLIASMWTKVTSQGTCALSPKQRTRRTNAPYRSCKKGSTNLRPVFDILNSGSRNRFTILSDDGPLLVHNCGYQGGFNALGKFNAAVPEESRAQWIAEWIRRGVKDNEEALSTFETYVADPRCSTEAGLRALKDQGWPYPTEDELFEIWGRDVVNKWRASRPKTVALWKGLETAAIKCVETGEPQSYGYITYRMEGAFLTCELPSGRKLYYPFPKLAMREMSYEGRTYSKLQLSHMTVDAETKQWVRRFAHGGLLTENVTQAVCRDILVEALLRLERAGFPIVLHVHDEAVDESPAGTRTLEEFEAVMTVAPAWAEGFPISAAGWVGERYRKD